MKTIVYAILGCILIYAGTTSCSGDRPDQEKLISDPYLSEQEEIKQAIYSIVRDLKIDVFDDVAVATFYPYITYVLNGKEIKGSGRQTFVFLNTKNGWKLVHEHGTPKQE